jgi:hypothetical protein
LIPNIDHLEKIRIESGLLTGTSKKRFMGSGRTGRHHNPVEVLLLNPFLDFVDTSFGTRIKVSLHKRNIGKGLSIICQCFHVQVPGDIGSAMANEHADLDV